ncbi:MAG: alpha-L-fucosidase [Candidatus Omnitrophica bacterium]|nr:alpha-L-fucosidase [Candidatus Omnitrophota bacterium]
MTAPKGSERIRWFHEARFGMFIHWGLYSLLGRGEWTMFVERIPKEEYSTLARRFHPRRFDPDAWAALAVESGMKYMVLTTRHHDGFCLFDSQVSDFTSVKTRAKRDFVAEFVTAARKAGLKVGFYYSLLDWRFPGYFEPKKHPRDKEAMIEQAHAQVRELMTQYGKIDILWYDGGWVPSLPGVDMAEFWRAKDLNRAARKLQPHILINNRSGLDEDLDTPEQHVTASVPGRGWESCMTIGDPCGWGYIRHNPNMKTVTQLIQHLVTAAAGEGNFLLNVGPQPDGEVRNREAARLREVGEWLRLHGEGIYGSERCLLKDSMLGLWTAKGTTGYLHVFRWPGESAVQACVGTRALSATLLATGETLKTRQERNGRLVIQGLPKAPPNPHASVIKVEFESRPEPIREKDRAAWLEGKAT